MQLPLINAPSPVSHVPSVQLLYGDCLEVMPKLKKGIAQLCFADLPYGAHKRMSWDKIIDWSAYWAGAKNVLANNAAHILTANFRFAMQAISANSKNFRYELIWEKRCAANFLMSRKRPLCYHELVLVFYNNLPTYNPQMLKKSASTHSRGTKWNGRILKSDHYQTPVIYHDTACDFIYPKSVLRGLNAERRPSQPFAPDATPSALKKTPLILKSAASAWPKSRLVWAFP